MFDLLSIEVAVAFFISATVSLIIIVRFSASQTSQLVRNDINAIQASHVRPVARIGGLGITLALMIVCPVAAEYPYQWSLYLLLPLSALPVFIVGLSEDLGYFASPNKRLLAAAVSGAVFVVLLGQYLTRTGIPILDMAMEYSAFAIVFSIFITVGVSHAFNLIDGLNGLSGLTAVGAALALAAISYKSGLNEHGDILLLFIAAIGGFLVFNFPFGKIFLGDAGAYFIGHSLSWMAVSILWNDTRVTPFAMLLIFFWPVADTLLAIARRIYFRQPVSYPDRMHFHQIVMRGIEIILLGHKKREIANPLATLITLPFLFAPMVSAVLFAYDHGYAAIACVFFAIVFIASYKLCISLVGKLRRSNYQAGDSSDI